MFFLFFFFTEVFCGKSKKGRIRMIMQLQFFKNIRQNEYFILISNFLSSFSPDSDDPNVIGILLKEFRLSIINTKKLYLQNHYFDFAKYKVMNQAIRTKWNIVHKAQKAGEAINEMEKSIFESRRPQNLIDDINYDQESEL